MEGLPLKTRRRYLVALIIAFLLAVPVLAFYASGYRLTRNLELIKTGGIYVEVPFSGASFYVDDTFEGTGSFFQKSFFIQDLLPDTYTVRIARDGFQDWQKEMTVHATRITNGKALLLPEETEVRIVPPYSGTATSTSGRAERIPNPAHTNVIELFAATSTGVDALPAGATTTIVRNNATTTVRERGDIGLWKDRRGLHAWWIGSDDRFPYFFCTIDGCSHELTIARAGDVGHFDFFPDDNQFVIVEWPDGVFVTELDMRGSQNIQYLYPVKGAQFRVFNGDIYILDGGTLLQVIR